MPGQTNTCARGNAAPPRVGRVAAICCERINVSIRASNSWRTVSGILAELRLTVTTIVVSWMPLIRLQQRMNTIEIVDSIKRLRTTVGDEFALLLVQRASFRVHPYDGQELGRPANRIGVLEADSCAVARHVLEVFGKTRGFQTSFAAPVGNLVFIYEARN